MSCGELKTDVQQKQGDRPPLLRSRLESEINGTTSLVMLQYHSFDFDTI